MQPAIREALDSIFGGADEIVGSHAPYAFEAERRYVADVREAVEEALGRPSPDRPSLDRRVRTWPTGHRRADRKQICACPFLRGDEA